MASKGGVEPDEEAYDFPWSPTTIGRWPSIPQYYGDSVRALLLSAAALMLIASPLYGDDTHVEFPYEVIGAIIAVGCAALINPRDRFFSLLAAVVSGVGTVIYAMWGISGYDGGNPVAFVLRVFIALLFLFAFYFSLTTVRAFALSTTDIDELVEKVEEEIEEDLVEGENEGYETVKKLETEETWIDQ